MILIFFTLTKVQFLIQTYTFIRKNFNIFLLLHRFKYLGTIKLNNIISKFLLKVKIFGWFVTILNTAPFGSSL